MGGYLTETYLSPLEVEKSVSVLDRGGSRTMYPNIGGFLK
jgi:hypothetical protein